MIARVVTYAVIALLALFVLATTFVLDHGGGSATPTADGAITIHDLSLTHDLYFGKTVTTEGTLGFSEETKQYQLVDDGQAIVITGYEQEALRALNGREVAVTGGSIAWD